MLHITQIHIITFGNHLIGFEEGIEKISSLLCDGPEIFILHAGIVLIEQLLFLQARLVLIHHMIGTNEYVRHILIFLRPVNRESCSHNRSLSVADVLLHPSFQG